MSPDLFRGFHGFLASAMLLLASAVGSADAEAQSSGAACGIRGFPAPTLCARARLDTVHATYIVIVDGSGSMQPIWRQVRQALSQFASAVLDGDILDVQLFSSGIQELIAPVPANASARASWVRTFQSLPAPKGAHTDLGVAANAALTQVKAAPAGRQIFVFLLTDGQHDAPPNSPYATLGSPAWRSLTSSVQTLETARPIDVSILRLKATADLTVLPSVFAGAIVVNAMSETQLREWFSRKARTVAVDKLRLAIAEELERPAFILSSPDPVVLGSGTARDNTLSATPNRSILTTTSEDAVLTTFDGGNTIALVGTIAAGQRVSARARADRPWYLPPRRGTQNAAIAVPVQSTFGPADELARIGISAGPQRDSVLIRAAIQGASLGALATYWSAVLAILAAIAALLVKIRWSMHRPKLRGQLTIARNAGGDETIDLTARGGTAYQVTDAQGAPVMTIEARARRGRTVVYAVPHSSPLLVSGRQIYSPARIYGAGALEHGDTTVHYLLR